MSCQSDCTCSEGEPFGELASSVPGFIDAYKFDEGKNVRVPFSHATAGGGRCTHDMHDCRPSHPYNAETEHVGFSPTRETLLAASSKRREVFGESHKW